jgi:hypothetical protein
MDFSVDSPEQLERRRISSDRRFSADKVRMDRRYSDTKFTDTRSEGAELGSLESIAKQLLPSTTKSFLSKNSQQQRPSPARHNGRHKSTPGRRSHSLGPEDNEPPSP